LVNKKEHIIKEDQTEKFSSYNRSKHGDKFGTGLNVGFFFFPAKYYSTAGCTG